MENLIWTVIVVVVFAQIGSSADKFAFVLGEKWRTRRLEDGGRDPGNAFVPPTRALMILRNFSLTLNFFFVPQNIQINQDINGRTLLHYAADYGQAEVVSYLISRGAEVNVSALFICEIDDSDIDFRFLTGT